MIPFPFCQVELHDEFFYVLQLFGYDHAAAPPLGKDIDPRDYFL